MLSSTAALKGADNGFRADAEGEEERIDWAYLTRKTRSEYRKRLNEETSTFVMGELVEKAWGTSLLDDHVLLRAWHMGGRARQAASMDPRCPSELTRAWFASWLDGQERETVMVAGYVMVATANRHKNVVDLVLASQGAGLGRWVRELRENASERALTGPWDEASALAGLRALRAENTTLAIELGLGDWVRGNLDALAHSPVPALRGLYLRAQDLTWPAGQEKYAHAWWPDWKGTLTDLREAIACVQEWNKA